MNAVEGLMAVVIFLVVAPASVCLGMWGLDRLTARLDRRLHRRKH